MPNQRAPFTLLAIFLAFVATLSLSGCVGVTGSGTQASNSNSGISSSGSLAASATSLSFGNVDLGGSGVLGVTITNAGKSNVTISNVSISGAGYTASGVSTGQMLTPGQTATLNVTFTPAATGILTGTATMTSNATNSPATVSLSGTGVQPVAHSVTLTWAASTPAVNGYNVYRSSGLVGPYTKLNSGLITTTQYNDSTVRAGQTYFYAATSVDSGNVESTYSNQASATVPTP